MIAVQARGAKELAERLNKAGREGLNRELVLGIRRATAFAHREVFTGFSGQPIRVRSGLTRASIRQDVDEKQLIGRVGTPMKHAKTLEYGATITPKRAKVLTIPLAAARTAAGKSRGGARQIGRMYDSTFWRKSKRGNLILFGVRGNQLVPLFVGVKRVKIAGRFVFQRSADKVGKRFLRDMVAAVRRSLD